MSRAESALGSVWDMAKAFSGMAASSACLEQTTYAIILQELCISLCDSLADGPLRQRDHFIYLWTLLQLIARGQAAIMHHDHSPCVSIEFLIVLPVASRGHPVINCKPLISLATHVGVSKEQMHDQIAGVLRTYFRHQHLQPIPLHQTLSHAALAYERIARQACDCVNAESAPDSSISFKDLSAPPSSGSKPPPQEFQRIGGQAVISSDGG